MSGDSTPFSILVIRLSAMGDVAMTVPVVQALRERYPGARIVMLTRPFFRPFFRAVEGIGFFEPDLAGRHKGLPGLFRLARDLGRFDLVADLHDVLRSQVLRRLMRLKGARVAVIDKGRAEKKALTRLKRKRFAPLTPTVERYRDVFLRLGLELPPVAPPSRVRCPLDRQTAALAGERIATWIGVAPFAQHAGKIYPMEKMREAVRRLAAQPGTRLFVFGGGEREKALAEMLAEGLPDVVPVVGRIGLSQELELISNLDLMLSMDSSAMHMASLFAVPVVSVWGATHPFAGFYGFGQDPADAVQVDLPCRPCSVYGNKPCAVGGYPCLNDISPEAVVERVLQVLDRNAASS